MAQPTNILYITSTLSRSGPTNQLYDLVKYLNRERFHPHILTLSGETQETRFEDFAGLGAELHSLSLSRIKGVFFSKVRLHQILNLVNPSVIHSQGIRADYLCSKLINYPARFATQHNYPYYDYPLKFGFLRGKIMAFSHFGSFNRIPSVIACSKTISDLNLKQRLIVEYIQNGVDMEDYSPITDSEKRYLRKQMSISTDSTIFVSVGSLIKRKATDIIINAFHRAKFSRDVKLLIIGDGPNRDEYEALARDNVNIKFIGQVLNVKDYLAASDCFVSASLAEGLPYTVIEAMATGLPVILSDIDSHKEILEIDPSAGETFSVGMIDELARCLESFTPSMAKSNASINIVRSKLNARSMSLAYQAAYINKLRTISDENPTL